MQSEGSRSATLLLLFLAAAMTVLASAPAADAQSQFTLLHNFSLEGGDGAGLWGSVAFDAQGNLYGTTSGGGIYNAGTVFELSPSSDGSWSENILASFANGDLNGQEPSSGAAVDTKGNVYVTTAGGGPYHGGTVLQFTPGSSGWILTDIHDFCSQTNCSDGSVPYAGVTIDSKGNLWGTANVVFELSPGSTGWTENVLYTFCTAFNCVGGAGALAGVTLDRAGNIFGETASGGHASAGVVYELRHAAGTWKETVPHSFLSFPHDGGGGSLGALAIDSAGNLYGTTISGGTNICFSGCGTIFKLAPTTNGHWKETILYNFASGSTGFGPGGGVVIDTAGNLYGTTIYGGDAFCGCGVVYKLAPSSSGTWTYSVLHTFVDIDGAIPDANMVLHEGKLYGTAATGGPGGGGVVFEITP
jgi:uncharacterized repeat protein (TIGR03803 family)